MPETRIVAKLLATTDVTDLIVDRLRPHNRKTKWGTDDSITYQRITTEFSNHATGTSTLAFARIQLDLWSSTPLGVRALTAAVRGALSGWSDDTGTPVITMSHLIDEQDMPMGPDSGEEATEYRVMQEYMVHFSS